MSFPLYVSPDMGTGVPAVNDGLADEYTARVEAGFGTGLFAYWPKDIAPKWSAEWQELARRYPNGFYLLLSPKVVNGVADFLEQTPKAWRSKITVCYWQEPEDEFPASKDRLTYRSRLGKLAPIVRSFGCRNGVHLQEWTLDPLNAKPWSNEKALSEFVANPRNIDVISWSLYTHWNGIDWKSRLIRIRDFSRKYLPGKPWIVGAAGFAVHDYEPVPSAARTDRAGRVMSAANWLKANGGSGFGWFDVCNFHGNGQDNLAAKDPELTKALRYVAEA